MKSIARYLKLEHTTVIRQASRTRDNAGTDQQVEDVKTLSFQPLALLRNDLPVNGSIIQAGIMQAGMPYELSGLAV